MVRHFKRWWNVWACIGILIFACVVATAQTETATSTNEPAVTVTDSASAKFFGAVSSVPRARDKEVSLVRMGMFAGRSGVAKGGQMVIEFNPFRRLGFYGVAGQSSINGYKTKDPDVGIVTANEKDRSAGGGTVLRLLTFKRSTIGAFGQVVWTTSSVYATYNVQYLDPSAPGGVVNIKGDYREKRSGVLGTIGGQFETPRWRGVPPFAIRVGKNIGNGLAAETGGGVYFAVSPMIDIRWRSMQKGYQQLARLIH